MSRTPRTLRRGRPELYSDYAADQAIWNTPAKRWSTLVILALALSLPWFLGRDLLGLARRRKVLYRIGNWVFR